MKCPLTPAGADLARSGPHTRARALAASTFCAAIALAGPAPVQAEEEPGYESVVRAPREAGSEAREDVSASASVITTERTPRSLESVPLLLSELPGVTVLRLGGYGAFATVSLRGSSPNQVLVYADGVPLASATTGATDIGMIPLSGADRIEVYRGSSPLGFGSSAIGGVVALTSESPQASRLAAHSGVGSFHTRMGGAEGAWVGERLRLLGRVNLFASAGDFRYRSDNGTLFDSSDDQDLERQNNDLDQVDGLVRGELALGSARRLTAALSFLDRDQGVPAGGKTPSLTARLAAQRFLGSASYEGRDDLGPGGRLKATAYSLVAEQRFNDEQGEVALVPTRTRDQSTTLGSTVTASRAFGAPVRLSAMVDGRHESFSPRDELAPTPLGLPGTRTAGAAGLELDLWSEALKLDVIPSARIEGAHDEVLDVDLFGHHAPTPRAEDHLLPVARLGLVERPGPSLALRANGGYYARLPTLFERYGNSGFLVGNPALEPERGLNADLGATWTRAARGFDVALDGAVFATDARNLIHLQKGTYHARYRNVGRARIVGVEASGAARALRHGRIVVQGSFADARDTSGVSGRDGRQLPHRPQVRAYGRPELVAWPLGREVTLGLYADADFTGRTYYDPANLVAARPRVLFGAGGEVAYRPGGLRLVASAYNLADARAADLLDFPLPGRSVFVTLHLASPSLDPHPKETLE